MFCSRLTLVLGLLLLPAISMLADLPRTEARETLETPFLDGALDEACYKSAAWQEIANACSPGAGCRGSARFAVCRDAHGLWIGVEVTDEKVVSQAREHDGAVWHDDSIEIFLAPQENLPLDPNVRECAHFIVNADASRFEEWMKGGIGDTNWNPFWQAASRRTPGGFTLELFLPYSLFSDRSVWNGNWRMNVLRNDKGGPRSLMSAWSSTRSPAFMDAFGVLETPGMDTRRFRVNLNGMCFRKSVRNGQSTTVLEVAGQGVPPSRPYEITAEIIAPDGQFASCRRVRFASGVDGRWMAEVPALLEKSGRVQARLALFDSEGKIYDQWHALQAELAPLSLRILAPAYRNTLFSSEPHREIRAEIHVNEPLVPGGKKELQAMVLDETGKPLAEQRLQAAPVLLFRFDATAFPPGKIRLSFRMSGQAKEALSHEMTIAAPPVGGNEVFIGVDGNLVVNGKPLFVHGFMGAGPRLDDIRKAKCNVVHSYSLHLCELPEIKARLDACHANGLYMILSPMHKSSVGFWGIRRPGARQTATRFDEAELRRMREMVTALREHPALLGWYLFDEPRGGEWIQELRRVYGILRELDPMHPVVGCDNGVDGCLGLQNGCDVVMLDMYLNPALNGQPLRPVSMILAAVERVASNLHPGKLLIYVPQAYDVDSFMKQDAVRAHRSPRVEESVAVTLGALTAGARGILAYKIGNPDVAKPGVRHSNAGIYASEELRKAYLDIIMPELKRLEPFFLAKGRCLPLENGVRKREAAGRVLSVQEHEPYAVRLP